MSVSIGCQYFKLLLTIDIRNLNDRNVKLQNGNQLSFKNTAERLNTTDMKIWGAYFDKQISSIYAHLNNANLKQAETIESRFADIINYCHLGLALFKERSK